MRNVFDQYGQHENRLTHALVCALAEDRALLRRFLRFALGRSRPPTRGLQIVEQQLPGEAPLSEDESQQRGISDAWLFNDAGWALVVESKVAATLRASQLRRHLATARRRGFDDVRLLVLSAVQPKVALPHGARSMLWSDLYAWLRRQAPSSQWAARVANYMEVLEGKMIADEYLKEGGLTVFSGIPFTKDNPYSYLEAKRVLGLAMAELRKMNELSRELGADLKGPGRPAITGREASVVWDFIPLKGAKKAEDPREFPHLTLGLDMTRATAMVTLPNRLRLALRRRLSDLSPGDFAALIEEAAKGLQKRLRAVRGVVPLMRALQRRYPTQRSVPIVDAALEFDLRTAFGNIVQTGRRPVRTQPQWLEATYAALAQKRSNLQVQVGAAFPYDACSAVHTPKAIVAFAGAWLACKPILDSVVGQA